jgi:hypothetical protein
MNHETPSECIPNQQKCLLIVIEPKFKALDLWARATAATTYFKTKAISKGRHLWLAGLLQKLIMLIKTLPLET